MAFGDFSSTKKDKTAENKGEKKDFVRWSNDYQKPQSSVFTVSDLAGEWTPGHIRNHVGDVLVVRVHGNDQFGKGADAYEVIHCDWVVVSGEYPGLVREEKVISSSAIIGLARRAASNGEHLIAGKVVEKKNTKHRGNNTMLLFEDLDEDESANAAIAALSLGWISSIEGVFPNIGDEQKAAVEQAIEAFKAAINQAAEDIIPVDEAAIAEHEAEKAKSKG